MWPNAGSVHFTDAAGGRGTEVRVELLYSTLPAEPWAHGGEIVRRGPRQQIRSDLKRLKSRLEAGVLPKRKDSPRARSTTQTQSRHHSDQVGEGFRGIFPGQRLARPSRSMITQRRPLYESNLLVRQERRAR